MFALLLHQLKGQKRSHADVTGHEARLQSVQWIRDNADALSKTPINQRLDANLKPVA